MRWSFCGKTQRQVASLIAGPHNALAELHSAVRRLRGAGVDWDGIGQALGTTAEEARERFEPVT